jgi:hypothetical protein
LGWSRPGKADIATKQILLFFWIFIFGVSGDKSGWEDRGGKSDTKGGNIDSTTLGAPHPTNAHHTQGKVCAVNDCDSIISGDAFVR